MLHSTSLLWHTGFVRKTADVVIVGAGVAGCSIAYHLTLLGIRDILLVERLSGAGQGSTSRANGGIRAQWSTAINIQLSLYSIAAFERFREETGGDCGLVQAGYLFMTATAQGEQLLRRNLALQQKLGVPSRCLTPAQISRLAPYARTDDLRCGTFCCRDGFIDPHGITLGYLQAARRHGAEILTDTEVTTIRSASGRVSSVETGRDSIATPAVVNAAGPYAGIVAGKAGIELPVFPVRRMLACTEAIGGAAPVIPMTIDIDTGLLIRREGDGILLAYSDPADLPGFDESFDPRFIETVSEKAVPRFPFLEEARISARRCWAGLYPESPDHHAIIGESPELPGFFLAAGFGGHGLMHSPATGRAIAELIAYGECRFMDVSPLRPARFVEQDLIVESTVL
jgi:sarcosine oxidase subunit beta